MLCSSNQERRLKTRGDEEAAMKVLKVRVEGRRGREGGGGEGKGRW